MQTHFKQVQFQNQLLNGCRRFLSTKQKTKINKIDCNNDLRSLSPWVLEQQRQVLFQQPKTEKLISKILFKDKHKDKLQSKHMNEDQNHINAQHGSSEDQKFYRIGNRILNSAQGNLGFRSKNNSLLWSKSLKYRQRRVKQPKIVTIYLKQINKSEQILVNPEYDLNKGKNLNPFLKNQKKREIEKFKILHTNQLANYYEKQRLSSLQKKIKYKIQKKPQHLSIKRPITKMIQQKQTQTQDLICKGQIIEITKATNRDRLNNTIS